MAEKRTTCFCAFEPVPCRVCRGIKERHERDRKNYLASMDYAAKSRKESFLEDLDDPAFCRKVMEKFGFIGKPDLQV